MRIGWSPHEGNVYSYKRLQEIPHSYHVRTLRNYCPYQEEGLSRTQPGWQLGLELAHLQNCERHISVVYKPPILWYFVT